MRNPREKKWSWTWFNSTSYGCLSEWIRVIETSKCVHDNTGRIGREIIPQNMKTIQNTYGQTILKKLLECILTQNDQIFEILNSSSLFSGSLCRFCKVGVVLRILHIGIRYSLLSLIFVAIDSFFDFSQGCPVTHPRFRLRQRTRPEGWSCRSSYGALNRRRTKWLPRGSWAIGPHLWLVELEDILIREKSHKILERNFKNTNCNRLNF